jgi:hypothetical protein
MASLILINFNPPKTDFKCRSCQNFRYFLIFNVSTLLKHLQNSLNTVSIFSKLTNYAFDESVILDLSKWKHQNILLKNH